MDCPTPQPEGPGSDLLPSMLVIVPYTAPEKKEKKKSREGLRIRDLPDTMSGETHASSTHEEEHEDGGGRRFPPHKKEGGVAGCRRGSTSSCPEEDV